MLSCKELVARSSDYLDAQLGLSGWLGVHLHLAMCANCRRFIYQMRTTQAVLREWPTTSQMPAEAFVERLVRLHDKP
jgi:predicted anti-sigma-YlaC factor YlaD